MTQENSDASTSGIASSNSVGRRRFVETVGAGGVVAALAGCTGDGDGNGENEFSGNGNGGNGGNGNGGNGGSTGNGGTDDPFVVGHLAPLDNPLGVGSHRCAQMAQAELNDNGGVMDREVEVHTEDTQSDPSETQNVTEQLIQQDDVDVLIGTFSSEATQAIQDLTAQFDVPLIITGSAAPGTLTETTGSDYEQYKNLFRSGPINSDFQAEAVADYATYLSDLHGWNEVAFLRDQAAWTGPFQELVPGFLDERGLEIVHESALSIEIDDFSPVMSNVEDSGADMVLRWFAHIQAFEMVGLWHELEYEFGIEGVHVTSMLPAYYQLTEGAATYETTSQSGAAGVTEITDKTIPFTERYVEQYAEDPDPPSKPMYMGYNTYDAMFVWAEAMERAGIGNARENLDDFVDAMLQTEYTGTAGTIEFYGPDSDYPHDVMEERDNDGVISNYPVTQWREEGEVECVFPEQHRTDDHVMPHWMS